MTSDPTPARIVDLIERLGRSVRLRSYADNLNPAQWEALRYLARCNARSNTPTALAGFLGTTKGTVSQTVTALERKGLVRKAFRPGQGRALSIKVTRRGRDLLRQDPTEAIETAMRRLVDQDRLGSADAVRETLNGLLRIVQDQCAQRSYGQCCTCRHFQVDAPGGLPHRCALWDEPVSAAQANEICAEHQPA